MGLLNVERMRDLRESLGLSQEQAAQRAGLSGRARWSDIESGQRSNVTMETLERIAAALQCDPRELIASKPTGRR